MLWSKWSDEKDDDDANSKDFGVVKIGTGEALTMLDRLVNLKNLSKEKKSFLTMKDKLAYWAKPRAINDYAILEYILCDRFYRLIFCFKTLQVASI